MVSELYIWPCGRSFWLMACIYYLNTILKVLIIGITHGKFDGKILTISIVISDLLSWDTSPKFDWPPHKIVDSSSG